MSDPFGGDDLPGDPSEDVQKIRELRNRDGNWEPPAVIEGVFASLTALVGLVWFLGLFVLDVDGTTWMGLGALGAVLFGVPAALVYALRRGGAALIQETIRGYIR